MELDELKAKDTRKYYPKRALYDSLTGTIVYWNKYRLYVNYKLKEGTGYIYITTYEDKNKNLVTMPISASSLVVHGTEEAPPQEPQQMTIFDFI